MNLEFAAPPRTGTTWFLEAASMYNLGHFQKTHIHKPFQGPSGESYRLTFVRHPVDWLWSYFHTIYPGKIGVPEVDKLHLGGDATSFDDYILRCYAQAEDNLLGSMFEAYKADSVIRLEDNPAAFAQLLSILGLGGKRESELLAGLSSLPRLNAGRATQGQLQKAVLKTVKLKEFDLYERFDYT